MNYVRIDFINCGDDFDFTIAPTWSDAMEYVESVEDEFMLVDDAGFKTWKEKGQLPEIKLSLVNMTEAEYSKWFHKNVKP